MGPQVHETTVLKHRDRSIRDNNEWPDFLLTSVEVRHPFTGGLVSLLTADADAPVTVVGRLGVLRKDRLRYLQNKTHTFPLTLEVPNVSLFSYGQYEEGEVALWAAGEAGWFQLKPSQAYRPVFIEMVEAVNALYFAADFHRDLTRYKLKTMPVEDVFAQYAAEPLHKCKTPEEASQIFEKHKRFLLTSMENGKEGIPWKQTQLYRYLLRESSLSSPSATSSDALTNALSMEKEINPPQRPPHAGKGKGKSTVRPRSGALTIKGVSRKRSFDVMEMEEDDEDVEEGVAETVENGQKEQTARSTSPLPLKKKSKRKRIDRITRRQKYAPDVLEEEDDDTMTVDDPPRPLPLLSHIPSLSANTILTPKQSPTRSIVRIVESPLPSYTPQGPGETWTCTFDGCSHRVYAATSPESRELIREHYRGHAFAAQAQIDLVYKEERPYLPVGNLIKKIRELAAVQRSRPGSMSAGSDGVVVGGAEWSGKAERRY